MRLRHGDDLSRHLGWRWPAPGHGRLRGRLFVILFRGKLGPAPLDASTTEFIGRRLGPGEGLGADVAAHARDVQIYGVAELGELSGDTHLAFANQAVDGPLQIVEQRDSDGAVDDQMPGQVGELAGRVHGGAVEDRRPLDAS